jgi:hypothetical protein
MRLLDLDLGQLFLARRLLVQTRRLETIVSRANIPLARLDAAIAFSRRVDAEARCALLARRLSARHERVEAGSGAGLTIRCFRLPDDFILNMTACLVVLPAPTQSAEDVVAAIRGLEGLHDRVCVVVSTDADQRRALQRFGDDPATMLVVPSSADLTRLLISPEPLDAFARMVARQVRITRLSPYQTRGGVQKESVFFGRTQLLAHILNREPANYLLVGGRQLGKSSLLKAIERRVRERGSLDCCYCSVGDMPIRVVLAQTLGLPEDADRMGIVRELRTMPNGQRRLMLLDECDVFLAAEEEKGFETLSAFRNLSEEGRCFFILAGFWRLFEAASLGYQSRIRNFGETLTISALEAEACRELITRPMAALNLEYESDTLVERIIQETGRRANLVAITCNEILTRLGREARTISEADVGQALARISHRG